MSDPIIPTRPEDPRPPQPAFQPVINVDVRTNVDSSAHVWRVAGTVLAMAAVVSLAYGLQTAGFGQLAAMGISATLSFFIPRMVRNGFIVLPQSKSDDERIESGKSALRQISGMIQAIIDRSSVLRLMLIAIAYGVAFVLLQMGVRTALGVFANVWIAAAFGGIIAAVICAPTLFVGLVRGLKSKVDPKGQA